MKMLGEKISQELSCDLKNKNAKMQNDVSGKKVLERNVASNDAGESEGTGQSTDRTPHRMSL